MPNHGKTSNHIVPTIRFGGLFLNSQHELRLFLLVRREEAYHGSVFVVYLRADLLVLGVCFRLLEIDSEVNFPEWRERLLIAGVQHYDGIELADGEEVNDGGDLLLGHLGSNDECL